MLIAGCCCCGASDAGVCGFSNDMSLVYCANTFSCGGRAASGGVPLPLVIRISPGTIWRTGPSGASGFAEKRKQRSLVGPSGYHSLASFHKDDRSGGARKLPNLFNCEKVGNGCGI